MNEKARKKLALGLELETQPTKTLLREIERVDSSIENTQKDIEIIKDDSSKIVEAINELDQKKADKKELDNAIASVQTIKGDRGFKGEKGDPGRDGKDGRDGIDGKNGVDGLPGRDGVDGKDGKDGKDGTEITGDAIIEKINDSEDFIEAERIKGIKSYDAEIATLQNRTQLLNQIATTRSTTPDLSGYVPYTGATTNVNLGTNYITSTAFVLPEGAYFENPTVGLQNTKWTGNVFYFDGLELAMQGNTISNANIPNYTPTSRTLTINGTALDLSANRSWTVGTVDGTGTANQVTYWSDSDTVTGGASNTIVNGTTPETRLTETTNSEYTRLTKLGSASSYVGTRYNRVNVVGGTGNAVNLVKASNQYVTVPDSSAFTFGNGSVDSPFSVSGWYYITDATDICLFSKGGASNYEYGVATVADTLYVNMYSLNGATYLQQNTNSTITSLENTWAHIVVTYSGSKTDAGIKVYINGSSVALTAGGSGYTGMNNGDKPLEIGRRFGSGTYDFSGKIDEFVVYNVELSAGDITTMYAAGVGVYTTPTANTLAIWHFDESAGTDATDSSGNAHTGTLVNSATWVTGKIATASAVAEAQVWKSQSGTNALENGIHTWGNTTGRSVIEGVLHNYNIGGSTKATWSTSGFLITDTLQNTGATTLIANSAAVVPLTVKGASSQSGLLTDWQLSTGSSVASISPAAVFTVNGPTGLSPTIRITDADLATGMTDFGPTTMALRLGQLGSTTGGMQFLGLESGGYDALRFTGVSTSPTQAVIWFNSGKKSGTGATNLTGSEVHSEWVSYDQTISYLKLQVNSFIVNESGGDVDFRVETDNYDSLFSDASNNSIMLMSNAAGKVGFYGTTAIVQPTTGVAEATFVENAGGVAVNDDSTFDGYTIRQVVKALRNYGLLA